MFDNAIEKDVILSLIRSLDNSDKDADVKITKISQTPTKDDDFMPSYSDTNKIKLEDVSIEDDVNNLLTDKKSDFARNADLSY